MTDARPPANDDNPAPATPSPAEAPSDQTPPRRRRAGWIAGVIAVALGLVLATVAVTALVVDEDDDDHDARVDARQTQVLSTDTDTDIISRDDAIRAALAAAGAGQVTDVDLDHEAGRLVYEIEIRRDPANPNLETDVVVDARSGAVLTVHDELDEP